MMCNSITGQTVSDSQVLAEMAEHVAAGHKLIFQQTTPQTEPIMYELGLAFRVLRETSQEEYLREGPNGSTLLDPPVFYYEVEPAD